MIDLDDPVVLAALAKLFNLPKGASKNLVLSEARSCCSFCGACSGAKNPRHASAAYAVMRPEYADLSRLQG